MKNTPNDGAPNTPKAVSSKPMGPGMMQQAALTAQKAMKPNAPNMVTADEQLQTPTTNKIAAAKSSGQNS